MVHLQRFEGKYGAEGLLVFAISMLGDAEKARSLNAELGLTYPVFDGRRSELGRRYAYG
jgi:hypothetical protein